MRGVVCAYNDTTVLKFWAGLSGRCLSSPNINKNSKTWRECWLNYTYTLLIREFYRIVDSSYRICQYLHSTHKKISPYINFPHPNSTKLAHHFYRKLAFFGQQWVNQFCFFTDACSRPCDAVSVTWDPTRGIGFSWTLCHATTNAIVMLIIVRPG